MRYISYCTPNALAAVSVRNIMLKGFGISDPSVYIGIIVLLVWIVMSTGFTLFIMKKRKFSENY